MLGIHPKKGGIVSSAYSAMNYILISALLMELSLEKKIDFQNNKIVLKSEKSSSDVHQFLLKKFAKSKKQLKISTWMTKLNFSSKYIKGMIQKELVKKRVIKLAQKRFLFFRWKSPEILNYQLLYKTVTKIENQIFKGTENPEHLVLISFLKPAGLLKRLFPEFEKRKMAKHKINQVLHRNQLSVAVSNSIAASQAVMVSVGVINSTQTVYSGS
jgi:hypothetical protein